ncbi:MAG: Sec-independent protein translocase subunit TatA/TatB [Flavobacterium sp.]|jgi:sec-independent protein translocase protein TatA
MFGIDGGELIVILVAILMLFGSDKVPEFARSFAKIMNQFKNASNDIKNEINKTIDVKDISEKVNQEIENAKSKYLNQSNNFVENIDQELNKTKEDIDNFTGPIKRM